MNYRHAFHAGNIGDVLKHMVFARVITYLQSKPGGFRIIDTHAGLGRYDLTKGDAQRTGEWRQGVGRVLEADMPKKVAEILAPWLDVVRGMEENAKKLSVYPGSPLLARKLMREQDRLTVTELHPDDFQKLAELFAGDVHVKAIELDGWNALRGFVPPKEKRGIVLIDPAFEETNEFEKLATGLYKGWRRWGTGCFIAWYPIKDKKTVKRFYDAMSVSGIERIMVAEHFAGQARADGPMMGSGLIMINPPWTLKGELDTVLPWLTTTLAQGRGADWRVLQLTGEK
ncbi:23S rRNA (adenine(2030)-N(6))-methyltransferase RlmJ [Stappia sp.]|uniref:23S rRNA (adenine(2030)-N(6))-methyltransferase RlmJ n=1 Tax=Stappia sp. TaxID=1870903 RepID=UPI003A99F4AC